MSRVGKLPVPVPDGVKIDLKDSHLKVTGPKGTLERDFDPCITVHVGEGEILVTRSTDQREHRAKHGLTRALINNMVLGTTQGFEKILEIQGVGYRASMQGKNLNLALGFSHPVTVEPPEGIELTVEGTNVIKVTGIDKQQVGQVAAQIRAWRKPEPYKGKGIRYRNEYVRRKAGKAGVTK
ncbi:MAG: 50S ribosomal protein L6 [Candidatus Hydrogenedentes bacterium]|nr:50S ribosomal protein L6 [Candidatus Hydrogenedentota bacterium]